MKTLRPSKAHRWLVCPGSLQYPDGPPSEAAEDGTHSHAVLEEVLRGRQPLAGDIIMNRKVTGEQISQAIEVRDWLRQWLKKPGAQLFPETRLDCGPALMLPPHALEGTADAVIYLRDEVIVVDAKFGHIRIEPQGNPQLMLYACGALLDAIECGDNPQKITLVIAQPNHEGVMEFREDLLTREQLKQWAVSMHQYAQRAWEGSPVRHADPDACRFCPGRNNCDERLNLAYDAVREEWQAEKSLEELLPLVPMLRRICDDLEAKAVRTLLENRPVPGYKLVESRSIRRWPEGQEDQIAGSITALGIKAQDILESKLLSPAKMEKKFGKEFVKTLPVLKPKGAPKLAPEKDPRPALSANEFTPEEVAELLKS